MAHPPCFSAAPGRDARRTHQRDRSEYFRPYERAHQIEQPEGIEIAIVIGFPAGAAIAALVRRDHVIAGFRQRRHHVVPDRQVRESRAAAARKAGLAFRTRLSGHASHAVDPVDKAQSDRGRARYSCAQAVRTWMDKPTSRNPVTYVGE